MEFDVVCRTCLKEGEMKSIYESYKPEGDRKIFCLEMLQSFTSFQVNANDGYPRQICKACFNKLWSSYKFHRLCESSHEYLTDYINKSKLDIKQESKEEEECPDFVTSTKDFIPCEVKDDSDEIRVIESAQIELEMKTHEEKNPEDFDIPMDDYHNDVEADESFTEDDKKPLVDLEKNKRRKKKKKRKNIKSTKKKECFQCSKIFKNQLSLLRHEERHMLADNPSLKREKTFDCSQCPVKFHIKEMLIKHEKCHPVRNKQSNIRDAIPCTHCNKMFKSKVCLMKHIDKHNVAVNTSEDVLTCSHCSKTFNDKAVFVNHEAGHLGLKIFYCEVCKEFSSSKTKHRECFKSKYHSFYQCDLCEKSYKIRTSMIAHLKTHESKVKFICSKEGCGKEYETVYAYNKHMYSHTNGKAICHICSKELVDNASLKIHLKRHSNMRAYPCSLCERKFYTSSQRLEHERRHANIRNHGCTLCDKRFVSSTNLKRHMLIHEGNFNEHCRFCDKRFLVRGNRYLHERLVHGVNDMVNESKFYSKERIKCSRIPKVATHPQNIQEKAYNSDFPGAKE